MVWAAVLVAVSFSGAGQQPPPPPPAPPALGPVRDPGRRLPPEPVGTAIIRGRVVAADTGSPIRHAQVNLSPMAPPATSTATPPGSPATSTQTLVSAISTEIRAATSLNLARPKSATTDAQGAFEFRDLPAGSYRLVASPGQYSAGYLSIAYGGKKPNGSGSFDPGTAIDLADGQTFDKASVALPRGAVITGRVTDENGEPLARVQVYTISFPAGSSRGVRTGGNAPTDDLGQFRLFGLAPSEYVVAAEARGNTFVPPNAPPETEEDRIGFLTTYYPNTPDEAAAQRVRTRAGAETSGIEIRMSSGRLLHMNGMVIDSQGRAVLRANGTLFKAATGGYMTTFGFSTDEQGHFQMRNIPPGNYRLTVRQQQTGPRNPDGSLVEPGEFATMPVSLMTDLDDVLVTMSPGVTITGNVVVEGTPLPSRSGQSAPPMRVIASPADPEASMGAPAPQPAVVAPDLTFTMKGFSGEFLLRGTAPQMFLKAVQLGGQDITDTPREFKAGDRVTIVLTTQASALEGTVTDAVGKPATEASLVLFSDDKSAWRSNSIRTRRGGSDTNGHFRLQGLLPGRYYLIALPRERMNGLTIGTDPAVFEALSKEATTVVVGEDEQRQIEIRISTGGG